MCRYIGNWWKKRKEKREPKKKIWRINPFNLGRFFATRIWFFGLFIFLGRFVKNNWDNCVDFSQLSGYNLLFVAFVFLLLLPLISGIRLSALGIGIETSAKPDSANEILERIKSDAKVENISGKRADTLAKELAEIKSVLTSAKIDPQGGKRK